MRRQRAGVKVTLDADQAFEACSAGAVLRAWDSVEHVIEERIGSRVVWVKRGKKESHIDVQ